ncbi:MAG: hypothetical protein IJI37_05320 [Opitutales bacterium]|nr:hypothetical protein [Opitutales bacterium]
MKKIAFTVFAAALCASAWAEIKMPSVFGDNMLLQREMPVKVWGLAEPNAQVRVEFAGQKKSTKAGADGAWSLKLDKMPADKNPREMSVFENGKLGAKFANVLVGEVWIAGGQSNMEFSLRFAQDAAKNLKEAGDPCLRYFSQNTRVLAQAPRFDSDQGKWTLPSPKTARMYSAVGYLFAKNLRAELDVPVAIIFAALGGSKMIAWTPEDAAGGCEYTKSVVEEFKKKNASYSYADALKAWEVQYARWQEIAKKRKAEGKRVFNSPHKPCENSCTRIAFTPCQLYNASVAPFAGFSARGVIWYQGEADSGGLFPTEIESPRGRSLDFFSEQMALLIKSWRAKFENPEMPFIQVQLASFRDQPGRNWPLTRAKQLAVSKIVPRCYTANIIDCGEEDNIHPKDKQTVANRLSAIALSQVYGKKGASPFAPAVKAVEYKGGKAIVDFGEPLEGRGEPRGFEAKVGGKWARADAELSGGKVSVSRGGAEIEGVRYLWKSWARPDAWLYGKNNLPAFSFEDAKK